MRLFSGTGKFSKGRTYSLRHDESVLALPDPEKSKQKQSTLPDGKRRLSFLRRTSSNSSAAGTRPNPVITKEGLMKQELASTPMPDQLELDSKFMQMVVSYLTYTHACTMYTRCIR